MNPLVKEKNTLLDPLYPKLKSYLLHVARNPVRQRLFQFPCDDALTSLPKPSKKKQNEWPCKSKKTTCTLHHFIWLFKSKFDLIV